MSNRLRPTITMLLIAWLLFPTLAASSPETGGSNNGARAALPAPELLSPANDGWVIELPLRLCWTYSYNGLQTNEVSFAIQIDNNPDFGSPEVDTGLGPGTYSFSPISMLSMGGKYFWHVNATNVSTKETTSSETRAFNLDLDPPVIQAAFINGTRGYTSDRQITVTIRAKDLSGVDRMRYGFEKSNWTDWVPYTENLTVALGPVDGKWTFYVQVRDRFGRWTQSSPMRIILDTLIPVGSIAINNGSTYATSQAVGLDLPANDTNGIRDMMVGNDPFFSGAGWLKYNTSLNWTLPPGDGWKTVYTKYRDPAGWESAVASASIFLDTTPPSCRFAINSGTAYANSTNVSLQIDAGDSVGIDAIIISNSERFPGARWMAFSPTINYILPQDDGPKMVYLKVRDLAGNEGPVVNASIILDTSFPESEVAELPSVCANLSFLVSWSGTDELSGILFYDVEYQQNLGPWTGWLYRTEATRAMFQGADGNSYSFRIRAADRAGNIEPFLEYPQNEIRVELPLPTVKIEWPVSGANIQEAFIATGSAGHPKPGTGIERVEYRIDGGPWNVANGSSNWDFKLDISNLGTGKHTFDVRSFGGVKYSQTAPRLFYVVKATSAQEKPPAPLESPLGSQFFVLTVVLVVVIGVLLLIKRSKR